MTCVNCAVQCKLHTTPHTGRDSFDSDVIPGRLIRHFSPSRIQLWRHMGLEYTQGHDRIAHPVLKQRMIDDTHTPVSAMSAHIFHTSPDQQKPPIALPLLLSVVLGEQGGGRDWRTLSFGSLARILLAAVTTLSRSDAATACARGWNSSKSPPSAMLAE